MELVKWGSWTLTYLKEFMRTMKEVEANIWLATNVTNNDTKGLM